MSSYSARLNDIKTREQPNDLFYTPAELAIELIAKVPIEEGDVLLDPFAGAGVWFDNYPAGFEKSWAEITRGVDFWSIEKRYDWLITNPPFSNLTKIFEKSCSLSIKGFAYLLPLNALSYSRLEALQTMGFKITSLSIFKNPKKWGIGFQMCFVVWTRTTSKSIIDMPKSEQIQQQLFDFKSQRGEEE